MAQDFTMTSDRITSLKNEIEAAIATADSAYGKKALEALDVYAGGKAWDYNMGFPLIETMKAALVAREPEFICVPLNRDGEEIAPVQEKVLRHYGIAVNMKQRAEEACDWASITGLAYGKVGFSLNGESQYGEADSDQQGSLWVTVPDATFCAVDPYCSKTDLSDARYTVEKIWMPKADLQARPYYNQEAVEEMKSKEVGSKYPEAKGIQTQGSSLLPDEYGLLELRELTIRNRYSGRLEIATFGDQGELLRDLQELPPQFHKFNLIPLIFFPRPRRFYGFGILKRVERICDAIDDAFTRVYDRWASAPEKIFAPVTGHPDKEKLLDDLTNEEMYNVVDSGEQGEFRKGIDILHGTTIYPDEINWIRMLIDLFQWVSGMSYIQLGAGSAKTATESGLVQRAGDMRSNRRMSVMERWVSEIGKRMLTFIRYHREYLPLKEILEPEEVEIWDAYEKRQSERERIKQDTDIEVRMSMPVNAAAIHRRDKMIELLRNLGNPLIIGMLQQQGKGLDMAKMVEQIVRDTGMSRSIIVDLQKQKQGGGQGMDMNALMQAAMGGRNAAV